MSIKYDKSYTYDIEKVRKDFPILQTEVYGKKLVYFDNGATTQKPRCVVSKIEKNYFNTNANVHRGVHFLSQQATEEHEAAREVVRSFINARHTHEIIFTRGTTESINLVDSSFGKTFLQPGDEVIVSQMEHNSNIVPWQLQSGVKLKVIPFDEKGALVLDKLDELINEKTKIIAVTHISNTLGTVNPIKKIAEIAHRHNLPVLVDGAQGAAHEIINVQELDVDFYAFSGHKVYGPTGIGVLYGKEEWLEKLQPYQGGGDMIDRVTFEKTTFAPLPFKFEAGTPDYISSTALAAAIKYVKSIGMDKIVNHERNLTEYAYKKLSAVKGIHFYGTTGGKSSVISFNIVGIHPYDVGTLLDKLGIAVRTGHHCAQPVMQTFGVEGMVRASFALYNTFEEIDQLADALHRIVSIFHKK